MQQHEIFLILKLHVFELVMAICSERNDKKTVPSVGHKHFYWVKMLHVSDYITINNLFNWRLNKPVYGLLNPKYAMFYWEYLQCPTGDILLFWLLPRGLQDYFY